MRFVFANQGGNVEHEFTAVALDWVINIAFGIVALFAALGGVWLGDRVLLRKIDLEEEIKKGNIAAAIAFGTMLAFSAIIISAAVK